MSSIPPIPFNKACALLSPTPGTPGMLSTLSPLSARKSITSSGGIPNFVFTPSTSISWFVMVLIKVTCSFTSCAMSLSPVLIRVSIPFSVACLANVPITSSASTPDSTITGNPIALMMACNGSIWLLSSSGIGGRFALYSL